MQGIYNFIPGRNCFWLMRCYRCSVFTVCVTYTVTLYVKYVLYFYIGTFQSSCVVPNVIILCRSSKSCFSGMLLRYCLSGFEMIPITPINTGISFAFTFHMHWISFIRPLYFRILSTSFLITFLSPVVSKSINIHVPFSIIMDYDVQFIVGNSSVSWHMLISHYGNLTFMTCDWY